MRITLGDMQLFTIGLYELNEDGTIIEDADGMPLETYDNSDIGDLPSLRLRSCWVLGSMGGLV